ncbi:transaldolase family protein [Streptomyces sp. NPDC000410]|uniref:transaldolase family protein n=1 Tax=Streptomyces sp. NPDC000410 TaxID=3154254 RepID=UPI00333451F3
MSTSNAVARLSAEGVSVWLEAGDAGTPDQGLVRRLLAAGQITGLDLAQADIGHDDAVDVARWACDLLLPEYERTGGRDGLVTLPSTVGSAAGRVADTAAHVRAARYLARETGRPNLLVSVPATVAGVAAIAPLLAEGTGVQAGPVFSMQRYHQVAAAHLAGLEQARRRGLDLSAIASTAAFRVSPMDMEVDKLLDRAGSDESKALRGRAALAGARLAHRVFAETYDVRTRPEWRALAEAGARPQRLLWTDAYDRIPGRRATRYVEELVAPGTITALPAAALEQVAARARITGARAHREYECADRLFGYLQWFGIRYDDVVQDLERGYAHA